MPSKNPSQKVVFGPMAPLLTEQMPGRAVHKHDELQIATSRLFVHLLLTEAEYKRVCARLLKRVEKDSRETTKPKG